LACFPEKVNPFYPEDEGQTSARHAMQPINEYKRTVSYMTFPGRGMFIEIATRMPRTKMWIEYIKKPVISSRHKSAFATLRQTATSQPGHLCQ